MKFFYTFVLFFLTVFFCWVIVYNVFRTKEYFTSTLDDTDEKGAKEEDDDDAFFQQMNAEFTPINVDDVDNMVADLEKDDELAPEDIDFVDVDDIELPEQPSTPPVNISKLSKTRAIQADDDIEDE